MRLTPHPIHELTLPDDGKQHARAHTETPHTDAHASLWGRSQMKGKTSLGERERDEALCGCCPEASGEATARKRENGKKKPGAKERK